MRISPVSFGSLMICKIESGLPKPPVPQLIDTAFRTNKTLSGVYTLQPMKIHDEKIDGTVHDAARNFAFSLNEKYKSQLPKGSKKVILTEAEFYKNPRETEKKYFLTAATNYDEGTIHNAISNGSLFLSVRFSRPLH